MSDGLYMTHKMKNKSSYQNRAYYSVYIIIYENVCLDNENISFCTW